MVRSRFICLHCICVNTKELRIYIIFIFPWFIAVKNGIEITDAFSNIEDQLGLSYDWLLARKLQDPRWRQATFSLCFLIG